MMSSTLSGGFSKLHLSSQAVARPSGTFRNVGSIPSPMSISSRGSSSGDSNESISSDSSQDDVLDLQINEDDFMSEIDGRMTANGSRPNKRKRSNGADISAKRQKFVGQCASQPEPMTYLDCTPRFSIEERPNSQIVMQQKSQMAFLQEFKEFLDMSERELPDVNSFKQRLTGLQSECVVRLFEYFLTHSVARTKYFVCFVERFAAEKQRLTIEKIIPTVSEFQLVRHLYAVVSALQATGMNYAQAAFKVCQKYKDRSRDSVYVLWDIITCPRNHGIETFYKHIHEIAMVREYDFNSAEIDRLLHSCINSAKRLPPSTGENKENEGGHIRYLLTEKHKVLFKVVSIIMNKIDEKIEKNGTKADIRMLDGVYVPKFYDIYYCKNID